MLLLNFNWVSWHVFECVLIKSSRSCYVDLKASLKDDLWLVFQMKKEKKLSNVVYIDESFSDDLLA